MIRDNDRFNQSLETHKEWQLSYFNTIRGNLYKRAKQWETKREFEKAKTVRMEADRMKFQVDKKEAMINYGDCAKFKKKVSFIPNTCQLETQECFEHRR